MFLVSGLPWKQTTSHLFHSTTVCCFTTTDLSKMLPRVLRLYFRMLSYNQEVFYVPGKCQVSRAPVSLRTRLTYSSNSLKRLKPLLAPGWTNFLLLLSAFKRSYKCREMMEYACNSEDITKAVGRDSATLIHAILGKQSSGSSR